ncbi:Modification methylase MthTI [uncultured archaeon]|nr:Modification methylase MthTI [uncultured archaeon]
MNYIDLFAGAGGLSEGFVCSGFTPIAHIEMDDHACNTLKTRIAYHNLKANKQLDIYYNYLQEKITQEKLYAKIPREQLDTVICEKIDSSTIDSIFEKIDDLNKKEKIDLIIGGPPCQAYSLVGRSRDTNRMKNDTRNYLFKYYADFLKKYKPKYFVFENVTGLLTASNYFEQMKTLFESEEVGYSISWKILDAMEYGVLQKRRRVIVIGKRGNNKFDFPELEKTVNKWKIKSDLFADLPDLKPGGGEKIMGYKTGLTNYLETFEIRNGVDFVTQHVTRPHNERDLSIYEIAIQKWLKNGERLKYSDLPDHLKTHNNQKSFLDRFKVVDPDGCSHTVVAHIAKDGHYYIYPDFKQIRSLSVREAARIQSFPDDYFFEGGRSAAFRQIGNAVPPLMAKSIAESIKKLLTNIK